MQRLIWGLIFSIAVIAMSAGPVYAQARAPVTLTIETPAEVVQGERLEATVFLTDGTGKPLVGETIIFYETVRFFSYTDRVKIGETHTNFLGKAVMGYTPTMKNAGGLMAEYGGNEAYTAASAATSFSIAPTMRPSADVAPLLVLPRGVTSIWLLVLLVGVWVALGAALYQILRLPGDRNDRFSRQQAQQSSDV